MLQSLLRLTKHTLVYGAGHVLSRAVGLLLLPAYTNLISPEEMGVVAVIYLFLGFVVIVVQMGFGDAFLRHFIPAESEEERRQVFSNAWLPVLFVSLVFAAGLVIWSDAISDLVLRRTQYSVLFQFAGGVLLGDALAQIPLLALRAREQSVRYITLNLTQALVNASLNILFVVFLRWGIVGILVSNLISSYILLILLTPILVRFVRFRLSSRTISALALFGLPIVISGLCKVVLDLSDRFLLERLTDLETVGIYSTGYKLGQIMAIVVVGFRYAWSPFFLFTAKDAEARTLYAKVMTYFVILAGALLVFLTFFLKPILGLRVSGVAFLGPRYTGGLAVVPWILLAYFFHGIYCNLLAGVFIEKRTIVLSVVSVLGAGLNVAGNLLVIPMWGMIGAAVMTTASYGVMTAILFFYIQPRYPIPYEYGKIGKAILILGAVYTGGQLFQGGGAWMVLFGLVFLFYRIFGVLGRAEMEGMRRIVEKIRSAAGR